MSTTPDAFLGWSVSCFGWCGYCDGAGYCVVVVLGCLFHGLLLTSVQGDETCSKVGRLTLRFVMDWMNDAFGVEYLGGWGIAPVSLSLVSRLLFYRQLQVLAWEVLGGMFRKRKQAHSGTESGVIPSVQQITL